MICLNNTNRKKTEKQQQQQKTTQKTKKCNHKQIIMYIQKQNTIYNTEIEVEFATPQ